MRGDVNNDISLPFSKLRFIFEVEDAFALSAGNGRLYLIHDYNRCGGGYILLSRITESDILAGKLVTPSSALHLEISHSRPVDS